jgi:phosphoglycolate phosphatase-like HAD superfamily hydrolase
VNHSHKTLAFLFDVDGTLLTTDGAARESFVHAVREVLGVEDDLREVAFAGRTEPLILGDILARHGRRFEDGEEARFWDTVFDRMRVALGPDRGWLLPGVSELLDAVAREPRWACGLLTGNMTEMVRIKLTRFGIDSRFAFGSFGEEAPDRNRLACLAVDRVRRRYGIPARRCLVIGDTPHDVACARAAGARAVAVATGTVPHERLVVLEPDLALENFSSPERLLDWARGIEADDPE